MNVRQLDKRLDDTLCTFTEEMTSLIFVHDKEYLTRHDMEDISRQVFYCLHEMKDLIVKYLKENDR